MNRSKQGGMAKKTITVLLLGIALASVHLAEAQQVKKVPRIGVLWLYSPTIASPFAEAFRQGLRGLGYVEGQNIALEERWAEGRFDRLPSLAAELVRLKVDILDSAFSAMTRERAGALVVLPDAIFQNERRRIAGLAAKARLPAMYAWKEAVDEGGLMAYGASVPDIFRRAATYVDKILKGTKPADLPVEQPKKFEFIINLKAAKQIGLTIPPNVLARADKVIK